MVRGAQISVSGVVNGFQLRGHAKSESGGAGILVSVELTNVPGLNPIAILASGSSAASFSNIGLADSSFSTIEAGEVLGTTYRAEITYTYLDGEGALLGRLIQKSAITGEDGEYAVGETDLTGWFHGPGDFMFTPGFKILFRSLPDGSLEGVYGQVFECESGASFYALVRRQYFADAALGLGSDQVYVYRTNDLSIEDKGDTVLLTAKASSYWVPADLNELRTAISAG